MTVVNHNNHLLTSHLRHNSPKASIDAGLIAFDYLPESKLTSCQDLISDRGNVGFPLGIGPELLLAPRR